MTPAVGERSWLLTRKEFEAREEQQLAPYAMRSKETRGRKHTESEDDFRSVYRRDRDRIIHSTAFRRLEYKTQVFVNHEGDYYRTRLTHTLEVAQIAASVARALRLNEDLVETIALAHDLGHPPFGHTGEDVLRELMRDHGGFDHNLQGLRIVDWLEERYPQFKGLNLTWEVREGINKHRTPYDQTHQLTELDPQVGPLLEGQVGDIADEIAYDNHDLDDGITSGLIREQELAREVPLWAEADEAVRRRHASLTPELQKYQIIRTLIHWQVSDLMTESERRLRERRIATVEEVRHAPERLISFSEAMARKREPLKRFLWDRLYHHYRVVRMAHKARRFLTELFNVYVRKPEQLPTTTRLRLPQEDPYRVICDYVAGMTDRYCLEEYQKLFDPFTRV
ncbi:MAG: deoxyguanosinetriphosphate triphosphohydrolase [Candidatus Omnitrophica bacterium]|nr:deoxyguanosinetriphosphate triphosphohydrolase [Candidatus Omnitrophota bacterium]